MDIQKSKRRVEKREGLRYVAANVPMELYLELDKRRREENRSMNGEIIVALKRHLGTQG